jgi:hypothetical protein
MRKDRHRPQRHWPPGSGSLASPIATSCSSVPILPIRTSSSDTAAREPAASRSCSLPISTWWKRRPKTGRSIPSRSPSATDRSMVGAHSTSRTRSPSSPPISYGSSEKDSSRHGTWCFFTDGEEGGDFNGADWLVANHRNLVDAEYVINTDNDGVCRGLDSDQSGGLSDGILDVGRPLSPGGSVVAPGGAAPRTRPRATVGRIRTRIGGLIHFRRILPQRR